MKQQVTPQTGVGDRQRAGRLPASTPRNDCQMVISAKHLHAVFGVKDEAIPDSHRGRYEKPSTLL